MAVPRLIYDGDCGFCTWAAELLARHGEFEMVAFHELSPDQRARLPSDYETCAHLLTDDAVYSCGAAMDEAFRRTDLPGTSAISAAQNVPGYRFTRDRTYRFIADHRYWFGRFVNR